MTDRATTHLRSRSALPASGVDVQVISLSRNFGKEAALLAGLEHARQGAVLFIDGDGQHPPDLIGKLVGHWLDDGYDVVYTAKAHRENESAVHRFGVKTFYTLMNFRARHKIPEDAGDFRLLSPRAAAALRQMPERNRFFKGLASWIGFKQKRVDYEPAERTHGKTQLELCLADRALDRRPDLVLGRAAAACEPSGPGARARGADFRRSDPLRDGDLRKVRSRLSLARGRPDGARRRAAHHDRHRRRIYREDPVRAESAAGLFRRRAKLEDGRKRAQGRGGIA